MYVKLIFKNAKRSVKDYLIYIVTMTICVTLFYSFLSISSRYYQPDIGSEYDFILLRDGMKIAICLITLCLLFLIRFVNNYMLRRRQKEFAVQSIMGMEQKTIARLFFAETLIILRQLGVWFGLPVIVAVVVATVIVVYFIQTISAEVSAYIGLTTLMLQIGATVSILAVLLVCYFISTWILFKSSIRNTN